MAPALCMLIKSENVVIVDGDALEKKNLNRQLYHENEVGRNKAEALAYKYKCEHIPEYFSFGKRSHIPSDILMCCVDNNPARASVLQTCDFEGCSCIIASNEVLSSEAQVYHPKWKGTNLDPRTMNPEIAADRTGDPRGAVIGCTGEAQENNRQLVTANMMAASLALHLYVMHFIEGPKLDEETLPHLPHKLTNNATKMESFKSIVIPRQERTES